MYIKRAREAAKKSQKECAEYIGVTQKTLSQWEQGRGSPHCDAIIKLAEFLETTVNVLCFGEDPCLYLSHLKHIKKDEARKIVEAFDLLAEDNYQEYQDYLTTCKDIWWELKR